ncbi:MAG: LysM peptidoglycan-binding domain-containing protein [Erysipelotrichia bacterium]|nr:LysM peptidoglycan-binding domain-containing protein [Erysipelotrichia bacterium]
MIRIFFSLLLIINTLFAIDEIGIRVLKDLDIDPSFINEKSLEKIYEEYSSSSNLSYYNNLIKKSSLNAQIVRTEIEKENLPEAFFFIPLLESSFVNQTKGKNSPGGLWQIMPQTAKTLKLRNDEFVDERLDLIKSTDAASSYLKRYYKKFNKWYLALLSYNSGEGRVIHGVARASLDRYLELNPHMENDSNIKLYKSYIDEYARTKKGLSNLYIIYNRIGKQEKAYDFAYLVRNNKHKDYLAQSSITYIQKIIAFTIISKKDLFKSINNKAKYKLEKVKAPKGLQLKSLANIVGMNYNEFKTLNKHIKKEALPIDSKLYNIYIPQEKLELYNKKIVNINTNKQEKKVVETKNNNLSKKPIIYEVKKGDSLESIAKKFKVNLAKLKKDNKKSSNLIKIGEKIEIYK